jgi:alpha-galactosidase
VHLRTWHLNYVAGVVLGLLGFFQGASVIAQSFPNWAQTPPMGWNSWDSYGSSVTEPEVRANAEYMANNLSQYGWEYVVVDIRWYVSNENAHSYNQTNPIYNYDANGRLLPAANRFSSADGGAGGNLGFKPLADYMHSLGLKFGIHLMRGINQDVWNANLPIANSNYTTQDIQRNTWSGGGVDTGATWLHDNYGMEKTAAAQAYYDSMFDLYASWGVDYVKIDDMLRDFAHPNDSYYADEIEMVRTAIDKTGRPMVLSLSPGAAPLAQADHLSDNANLWRITNDLWDNWGNVYDMFARANEWTPYRGDGRWPDNDMLPLGRLGIRGHVGSDRMSNLTHNEQRTLMSLWSISRSPLMFGGDLPSNDAFTLSLLTNPEVIEVTQHSSNNRQLFRTNDHVAWVADAPNGGKYLALFNLNETSGENFDDLLGQASYVSGLITAATPGHATPINVDITGKNRLFLLVDDGDGPGGVPDDFSYDWADWVNMELQGPGGLSMSLTDLEWVSATSGWQGPEVGLNNEGSGPLQVDGVVYDDGIGTHAVSTIEFILPEGFTTLTGFAGLDDGGVGQQGATSSVRFAVTALAGEPGDETVSVNLADLGLSGDVAIRDLWSRTDLGTVQGIFSAALGAHASGLYLLTTAGVPGDYNDDGVVDAADYTVWRNNLGSSESLPNDASPGVTPEDYDVWKEHFGETAAGAASSTAVPEPTTQISLLLSSFLIHMGRVRAVVRRPASWSGGNAGRRGAARLRRVRCFARP